MSDLIERPNHEIVKKMFQSSMGKDPREHAIIAREINDFICGYYEQYIESMSARIDELEDKSTILAEIIAVKKMVAKLSRAINREPRKVKDIK